MKKLPWILQNGLMALLLYKGIYQGNEGLQNVLKFAIILYFTLTLWCSLNHNAFTRLKDRPRHISTHIEFVYGAAFAVTLAYFGWLGYAALSIATTGLYIGMEED